MEDLLRNLLNLWKNNPFPEIWLFCAFARQISCFILSDWLWKKRVFSWDKKFAELHSQKIRVIFPKKKFCAYLRELQCFVFAYLQSTVTRIKLRIHISIIFQFGRDGKREVTGLPPIGDGSKLKFHEKVKVLYADTLYVSLYKYKKRKNNFFPFFPIFLWKK